MLKYWIIIAKYNFLSDNIWIQWNLSWATAPPARQKQSLKTGGHL